jgi:hypothetical protein
VNKATGIFWINVLLYVFTAVTLASLAGWLTGGYRTLVVLHGLAGSALALASLAHAVQHRAWFRDGRYKGIRSAIKRSMTILTGVATLTAVVSGFAPWTFDGIGSFHTVTGFIAAWGLLVHGVKRLGCWKAAAQRCVNITGRDKAHMEP